MAPVESKHLVRFSTQALSAYRRAQTTASSPERGVGDAYDRMAGRLDEIEAALREKTHRQIGPLIEQVWLGVFFITSLLDGSRNPDIVTQIKALNLFVMTRLARARRSGLPEDVRGVSGVLRKLHELFLTLDLAKQRGRGGEEND